MTWTYSAVDLSTDLAKVRREIGDVDTTDQLLSDEEIDYALDDEGTVLGAAARAAEMIAASFARDFNWTADGTSVHKHERAAHYAALAGQLRRRSVGGITVAQARHDDGYQRNAGVDAHDVTTDWRED